MFRFDIFGFLGFFKKKIEVYSIEKYQQYVYKNMYLYFQLMMLKNTVIWVYTFKWFLFNSMDLDDFLSFFTTFTKREEK